MLILNLEMDQQIREVPCPCSWLSQCCNPGLPAMRLLLLQPGHGAPKGRPRNPKMTKPKNPLRLECKASCGKCHPWRGVVGNPFKQV